MKYTLLEMVQILLSSMDSDEVNSISDTVESNQVALLLKTVFYDLAVDLQLPEHDTLFELNASGDSDLPVLMTIPSNVIRIDWIKYDNQTDDDTYNYYVDVDFKPIDEFLDITQSLREETSDVGSMSATLNDETFEFLYRTDKFPDYYTTADDNSLIFDSYDSTEDTTLQKSKTMCYGSVYPEFTLSDTHTPDLDPTQFQYFLNRAKARAFSELKQIDNREAFGEARRQKIVIQKRKRRTPNLTELKRLPNYGRK